MRRAVTVGLLLAPQLALAQDFSGLPPCAENAALQAFGSSGCQLPDIKCICQSTQWIDSLEALFERACPPPAVTSALDFASSLCESVATVTPHFPAPTSAVLTLTTTVNGPQSVWVDSTTSITTTASLTPASMSTITSAWETRSWSMSTIQTTTAAAQATPVSSATSATNNTSLAASTTIPMPSLTPANFTGGCGSGQLDAGALSFIAGIYMMSYIAGCEVLGF